MPLCSMRKCCRLTTDLDPPRIWKLDVDVDDVTVYRIRQRLSYSFITCIRQFPLYRNTRKAELTCTSLVNWEPTLSGRAGRMREDARYLVTWSIFPAERKWNRVCVLPGQKWRKESLEDLDGLEECNFGRVVWETCADNIVTTQNYSAEISHNFTAVPASKLQ